MVIFFEGPAVENLGSRNLEDLMFKGSEVKDGPLHIHNGDEELGATEKTGEKSC